MGISHLKWPSFSNIHRLVANDEMQFEHNVIVLEKIDGSNLGVEVDGYGLVALHGRNTLLWHKGMDELPYNRKYGRVTGTLDPIADYVPRLVNFVKSLENVSTSVIVYGEWHKVHQDQQATACWYPFGYTVRKKEISHRTMTRDLYDAFVRHDLQPPRILFSGGLVTDAVEALHPMMMDPPSEQFEGVFITREHVSGTRYCAKWKTGSFEEQPSCAIHEATCPEDLQEFVAKLRSVYDTRIQKRDNTTKQRHTKPKQGSKLSLRRHKQQVTLALESVLSKSTVSAEDIRGMDRENRGRELKRLAEETRNDIKQQYASVGEDVPEAVYKLAGSVVARDVMRQGK